MDCRRRATPGYIWGALPCSNASAARFGRMSPASPAAHAAADGRVDRVRPRADVRRTDGSSAGCLTSARAGQRSPR
eukprot:373473-Prymnesium_polylepis.1